MATSQAADDVDRLLDAGCRIVGKTRLHEIAYGMTGVNAFEGSLQRFADRFHATLSRELEAR